MTGADDDAALERAANEPVRSVELGRDRQRRDATRVEEPLEQREIRVAAVLERMRSEPLGREERPFEVRADDSWGDALRRQRADRVDERVLGRGDERRLVRGHADLEQRFARLLVLIARRREEVDAREPVHLQVDEPGHRDPAARRGREAYLDDAAVRDLDVAGQERPPDDGSFDSEPHLAPPTAAATEPPAPASRSRASLASMPARSETSATRASPSAAASAASTSASLAPLASATFRRARSRSFAFPGSTATISPPNVRPRRIIVTVEIAFSTSFCAVPALRRVEPATTSGPTTTATSWSAAAASGVPRAHVTATVRAPAAAAASTAASVNRVVPLALIPTTASFGPTASRSSSAGPSIASSSSPPLSATIATTSPGAQPKVGPHSNASSSASRPEVPAPT